jgi:hypothetical protein
MVKIILHCTFNLFIILHTYVTLTVKIKDN